MTLILDNPAQPHLKRWTKLEYNQLVEAGQFSGQRLYLYRGELIEVAPMLSPHAVGVTQVNRWAVHEFDPPHFVRCQCPFETPGESILEPDIAVVTPDQMMRKPHPERALLLVEVSDSSLRIEREKAFDYAAAGVPEYWILDVVHRQLIVHREPVEDASAALGYRYASVRTLASGAMISPLAKPSVTVSVDEFLAGI